jgi:hypothetical protein
MFHVAPAGGRLSAAMTGETAWPTKTAGAT